MLDKQGFDKWAGSYDRTVSSDDKAGEYPFAGYSEVLSEVSRLIKEPRGAEILDIGTGTGKFSSGLYAEGAKICGVDFSAAMLDKARATMPGGEFHLFNFGEGLPRELTGRKFDYIISAYAFHHLADKAKAAFLLSLAGSLKSGGRIIIADVAFRTARDLAACREKSGNKWDDDEIYMVEETLLPLLKDSGLSVRYRQISSCAGILTMH